MLPIDYGFVSICLSEEGCSPAGNLSVRNISTLADEESRIARITRCAMKNLTNTLRIMYFMAAHDLRLYRFASHLVPLVTHDITGGWDWTAEPEIRGALGQIGLAVRAKALKVSTHLPDYCVMTAEEPGFGHVERYLNYHLKLFELMDLDESAKIVTHVGGKYGDMSRALRRLEDNWVRLPNEAQSRIVLENDDTTYSAAETLEVCGRLGVPMVLDVHHHWCRNDGERLEELVPQIFATWTDRTPKVHVSSPRSEREPRAHADYVDSRSFVGFADIALNYGPFDVMVEAKMKDIALLRLIEELPQKLKPPSTPKVFSGSCPLV